MSSSSGPAGHRDRARRRGRWLAANVAVLALGVGLLATVSSRPNEVWMTYYARGRGLVVAHEIGGREVDAGPWIVSRDAEGALVAVSSYRPYSIVSDALQLVGLSQDRRMWFVVTGREHVDADGQRWRQLEESAPGAVINRNTESALSHGPR